MFYFKHIIQFHIDEKCTMNFILTSPGVIGEGGIVEWLGGCVEAVTSCELLGGFSSV